MPPLSAVLLIFSFQFSLHFFNISLARPHQHCSMLLVLIRNIGNQALPKIWGGTLLVWNVQLREKDFELILMVKMETRHPVVCQFGREFPAICSHFGVMTACSRITWNFFLAIFEKKTSYGKIFKILFRKFLPPHRLMLLCLNVLKFFPREIDEIMRYLQYKKQTKL